MTPDTEERIHRFFKQLTVAVAHIPRPVLEAMAYGIGLFWYAIDKRHRDVALANMEKAYGKTRSTAWRKRLCRKNFIHFARLFLEIPRLVRFRKEEADKWFTATGLHHFQEAEKTGRPIFILSAHHGNWELLALSAPILCQRPVHMIVRPLDFPPLQRLVHELRTATGNVMVDKDHLGRRIGRLMKEGAVMGILLDQRAAPAERVNVPFFGEPAPTSKGLAFFALRYNAIVLPAFTHRGRDGRYVSTFSAPVPITKTGDLAADVATNTARFNAVIEAEIRNHPENWFWVHSRFHKWKRK